MASEAPNAPAPPPEVDPAGLIEQIAKSLVDAPAEVSVAAVREDDATVLELRVAPGDVGKVIGKQGRTARAFRSLLAAVGLKADQRFELEILE